MRSFLPPLILFMLLAAWGSALADWNPDDPAKWVQLPDLSVYGIDVNAIEPFILADDFLCTEEGAITGIHIWGSWRGDQLPPDGDPGSVTFTLSIHADIPANPPDEPYSRPGDLLWMRTFQPGDFTARIWQAEIEEGWMDPPDGYVFPGDWTCWQYNFPIPTADAFYQQGSPDTPIVYWLDVQAVTVDPAVAVFGWKTSMEHWNDAAVWGMGVEPYPGPWEPLRYPPGHELMGQPIDLAFVIAGEENLDFGDAPDSPVAPGYPTLLASNGARHTIGGPWLGDAADAPDPEADGQPDPAALGDDSDGNDDEDGVVFTILHVGQPDTVTFTVSGGGGNVQGWVDFDGNKVWDASELIVSGGFAPGNHQVVFTTPASALTGATFARFRISTLAGLPPDGPAPDGEVEDHRVTIRELPPELDFGDAPDFPGAPAYPTLLASNGARHTPIGPWLGDDGDAPDPEADGQPHPSALGDDNDGNDDEDGVTLPTLTVGTMGNCTVQVNGGGGVLSAWIDFNNNQVWEEPAERIYGGYLADGTYTLNVVVPIYAVAGTTAARFRITTDGLVPPTGPAGDGEVEDYMVTIEPETQSFKWEQPPDLEVTGIDVEATMEYILADDFLCTETGPITDIEIWGSWLEDHIPFFEDPLAVRFTLSFHRDIPADESPTGYSMPGEVLWIRTFEPGTFAADVWASDIEEGWLRPPTDYVFPADWTCWLYSFHLDETEAFIQQGTPDTPVVYWLDVQAEPVDPESRFGWKTSIEHWNDDAVWGQGMEPYPGPWSELIYPPGHVWEGQSIDLAFRLGSFVAPTLDFGDAPDPTYPTYLATGGANHLIVPGVYLGSGVDPDLDGQPDPFALGDDNDGNDDEGDIKWAPGVVPDSLCTLCVVASTAGYLDAWLDFEGNGVWDMPRDQIFWSAPLNPGMNELPFLVPGWAVPNIDTFARLRFSTTGGLLLSGPALDGEVEDHLVHIYPDFTGVPDRDVQGLRLHQNVPNPFNPQTAINFDLPRDGEVELTIYALDGKRVRTLVHRSLTAGRHTVKWDGRAGDGRPVASGTYLYRLVAEGRVLSQRMVLIR